MSDANERVGPGVSARVVFFALIALVLIAIAPALLGTWVYDDHALPVQPLYSRWSDVWLAFVRGSDAYFRALRPEEPLASGGQTWRPIPNALFALVNVTVGPSPFAHHLVSLLAHVAAIGALVRWAAKDGRVRSAHALVIAVFALHPALIEAYAYINGRSDAFAGAALVAGAVALKEQRWGWWFFALLVAVASKETSLIASLFVLLAFARSERRAWLGWCCAVAIGVAVRAALLGSNATIHSDVSLLSLLSTWLRWIAIAGESLVVPSVRAMRLLAWDASAPWSLRAALGLLVVLGAFVMVRGWTARVLLTGAVVTVSPAILVTNAFWLGSDRYLYQPAALLALAALSMSDARASSVERRVTPLLSALTVFVLMVLTALSSLSYRSERWFAARMRDARPEDPTGYIVGAREAIVTNDPVTARELLGATSGLRVAPSQAHRIILLAISLGDLALADRALRAQRERGPLSARLLADLFDLRARQSQWDEAARAANELLASAPRERERRARVLMNTARAWPAQLRREAEERGVLASLR